MLAASGWSGSRPNRSASSASWFLAAFFSFFLCFFLCGLCSTRGGEMSSSPFLQLRRKKTHRPAFFEDMLTKHYSRYDGSLIYRRTL